jgi:hypothetical protein
MTEKNLSENSNQEQDLSKQQKKIIERKVRAALAMGGNVNSDVINNLNAYVINNLNADVIKNVTQKIKEWDSIPLLDMPYSKMLAGIKEKKLVHMQSTFGDIESWEQACAAENNICNTPMCTAGHLVHMAGEIGYALREKYGWSSAASLIHLKTHPDYPIQNFGEIPQEYALAYIEEMAEMEEKEAEKK